MSEYPQIDFDGLTNAELDWVQDGTAGNVKLAEVSAPSGTASGVGLLYVDSSDSTLHYQNDSGTDTNLSTAGGSPTNAQYVVLAVNGSLSAERVLTGTPGQVIFTDAGANGNITASIPQNIDTTASVTFNTITASTAQINGSAQITGSATLGSLRLGTDLAIEDEGTG